MSSAVDTFLNTLARSRLLEPDEIQSLRPRWLQVAGGEASDLAKFLAWLVACGVTTVALEAGGVYGHVLFLTLLEAGLEVLVTPPQFARQIKGRPKTDRLDCQWIRRLHHLGMLPPVFRPDDPTHTLRDYVRQRANLVRLGAQHVQRMQNGVPHEKRTRG